VTNMRPVSGGDDKAGGHIGSTSGVVDPGQYRDKERRPGRLVEGCAWILVVGWPSPKGEDISLDEQVLLQQP